MVTQQEPLKFEGINKLNQRPIDINLEVFYVDHAFAGIKLRSSYDYKETSFIEAFAKNFMLRVYHGQIKNFKATVNRSKEMICFNLSGLSNEFAENGQRIIAFECGGEIATLISCFCSSSPPFEKEKPVPVTQKNNEFMITRPQFTFLK